MPSFFVLAVVFFIASLSISSKTPTTTTFFVSADVRCRTGEFAHSCPSEMPVCCFDLGGYSIGCCRTFTECTPNGDCDPGPPPPTNTSATGLQTINTVVHLSWTSIYLTAACTIVTLLIIAGGIFLSGQFRSWMARRRVEIRARQLREAGLLGIDGEVTGGEGGEETQPDLGYEPDAEVTSDDEREFRTTVLSSEQAILEHAIAEANRDKGGVIGRVSAWFKSSASTKNMTELMESPRQTAATKKEKRNGASSQHRLGAAAGDSDDASTTVSTTNSTNIQYQLGGRGDEDVITDANETTHLLSSPSSAANKDDVLSNDNSGAAAATSHPQPAASSLPLADPTERFLLANCTLCKIRLSNCTLLPCMHSSLCEDCAKHLKRCSECKTIIKKRVKIFTS